MTVQPASTLDSARRIWKEIVGLPAEVAEAFEVHLDSQDYILSFQGRSLALPDVFFREAVPSWLSAETLPRPPFQAYDPAGRGLDCPLVSMPVPVLFGRDLAQDRGDFLPIDIFGSVFFLLSRYEEAARPVQDEHGRFPASASLAKDAGFLERPLADEYLEILWAGLWRVWPGLERESRQGRVLVSCDVDWPFDPAGRSVALALRKGGAKLLRHGSLSGVKQAAGNFFSTLRGDYGQDPYYNSLLWIMEVNERAGNRVAFNFIPRQSDPVRDNGFGLDAPGIRDLLRIIHERGHEIGFHPGYNTYDQPDTFSQSATYFWKVMESEGIQQDKFGGRQHYLRWNTPVTARLWEENGFDYDGTLGFADHAGFRCGTCREFPFLELDGDRPAPKLKERPLVLMECTVTDDCYMALGHSKEALDRMLNLRRKCHQFGGDFTLLWHNTRLETPEDREFYLQLIQAS